MAELRMTHEAALARVPDRALPDFWVGDIATLARHLRGRQRRGEVEVIAESPGGRAVSLVSYGAPEAAAHAANFNSAVGAREPAAYMDKAAREKPVVYFVGPVHGHETEGLTGLVNLIQVMETGADLRGRPQPELRELGDRCRLLIVPCGNPDGVARFQPGMLNGMALQDIAFWGQGTWADATLCLWPDCKRRHPMVGDNVGFLGAYFNDDGVNPMHDEWTAPLSAEAAALVRVARDAGPDLAVSLHSHQAAPALLRPAYVPLEVQAEVAALAQATYACFAAAGLPHGSLFEPQAEAGPTPAPFNLTSALYHVSGATSFTFECPHGTTGEAACPVTPDEILDVQLLLYRMILAHALFEKARA